MSYSYTSSETTTFTITHAKHIAAKVATDLKRIQRFYGKPSDEDIAAYEAELIEFLKNDFVLTVTYGFKRDGNWIEPTLKYTATDLAGNSANDDDPGRIKPGAYIEGASFTSFMMYSGKYSNLSPAEKGNFEKTLPFKRSVGSEPGISGYLSSDRTYSAGGRALNRSSVRSL